jgi:serine/threonine-protein kinase
MLVYDWAEGELLHAPAERRSDPATAFQRFRRLAADEIAAAVAAAIGVHVGLCGRGWVACDFYDGAMMYDFAARRLSMFDLDSYSRGPFVNQMGRLFGSERFMAPEEFVKGALIDERTTVFNLGRCAAVFLGDGTVARAAFRGSDAQHAAMAAACQPDPDRRLQRVADLAATWAQSG